jgi:hypothetical protein
VGFRFSRRIKIAPGVRINIGLKGASVSVGPRGASITAGRKGIYANASIPGTGLSYRERLDKPKRQATPIRPIEPPLPDNIKISFDESGALVMNDDAGNALQAQIRLRAIKAFKDQIISFGDERAAEINDSTQKIARIHCDTPPPPPHITLHAYPISKPIKPSDPRAAPEGSAERIVKEGVWSDYMEGLAAWRAAKSRYECVNVTPTDTLPYENALEAALTELTWPRETIISMELASNKTTLLVDVDLPEIDDLPMSVCVFDHRKLALAEKALVPKVIKKVYKEHVFGIVFRITGQAFASNPILSEVRIAGYTQRLSAATGSLEDVYIICAKVKRADWSNIVFDNLPMIDPVEALDKFDLTASIDSKGSMLAILPNF